MQIMIDIPDKVYGVIKYFEPAFDSEYKEGDDIKTVLMKGILKGTPLPKGHGRLVDIDNLYAQRVESNNPFFTIPELGEVVPVDAIEKYATTIIEQKEEDA